MAEEAKLLSMLFGLLAMLTALGFGIVSVTTSHWYDDGNKRYGLWIECTEEDGVCDDLSNVHDLVYFTRAFTIMAAITLLVLIVVALYTITTESSLHKICVGLLLLGQAVLQIVGTASYTGYRTDNTSGFDKKNWDWSFEMAWASAAFSFFGSVCFLLAGTIFTTSRQYQYKTYNI